MRKSARGIAIIDNQLLTIHRIKANDEYYVIPGGGIELNESPVEAVKREFMEELGIEVSVSEEKPVYVLETEKEIQHFFLVQYISGEIGTGEGPEFNGDPEYSGRGEYLPELLDMSLLANYNLVPTEIKKSLIEDFQSNQSLDTIERKLLRRN